MSTLLLLAGTTLLLALGAGASIPPLNGTVRTYYIAAEEVEWVRSFSPLCACV